MMKVTRMDTNLWGHESFEYVGYDKEAETFSIFLPEECCLSFTSVKEQVVFSFLLALDKESFILQKLIPFFPFEKSSAESIHLAQ
ncbi:MULTISPECIES: hypothetical protein [Bacillaceae]|uniref:hypothetical protein n=1 Tax=Bacillaceae TaxID=186817 RepID=UPI000BA7BD8D|nr:hypothetical protein [Virgibacillus sp. 7505]